jgi:hypothetical protein
MDKINHRLIIAVNSTNKDNNFIVWDYMIYFMNNQLNNFKYYSGHRNLTSDFILI